MSTHPIKPPKTYIQQVFPFINQQPKTKTTIQVMKQSLLFQELVEEFLMTSNVTHVIKWDTVPFNAQTRQWLPLKMILTIKTKIKT